MTIRDKEAEIEEEFGLYDDWTDKYEYIIELGRTLPAFDAAFRNEDQLIKGCQSQVWLHAAFDGSLMHFNADSDAQIPKGIVALLLPLLRLLLLLLLFLLTLILMLVLVLVLVLTFILTVLLYLCF